MLYHFKFLPGNQTISCDFSDCRSPFNKNFMFTTTKDYILPWCVCGRPSCSVGQLGVVLEPVGYPGNPPNCPGLAHQYGKNQHTLDEEISIRVKED